MTKFKLTKVEEKDRPRTMKILDGLIPFVCLKCDTKEKIVSTLFLVNEDIETIEDERMIKQIMKKRFGIERYGVFYTGTKTILTVAKCQKCQSHDIFWDY